MFKIENLGDVVDRYSEWKETIGPKDGIQDVINRFLKWVHENTPEATAIEEASMNLLLYGNAVKSPELIDFAVSHGADLNMAASIAAHDPWVKLFERIYYLAVSNGVQLDLKALNHRARVGRQFEISQFLLSIGAPKSYAAASFGGLEPFPEGDREGDLPSLGEYGDSGG